MVDKEIETNGNEWIGAEKKYTIFSKWRFKFILLFVNCGTFYSNATEVYS